MWNLRTTLWIVLVCYLILQVVKAESNGPTKEIKAVNNEGKSKSEKRESYRQEGTPSESKNRQQKTISNDEPFKPIYRPAYTAHQRDATQKFEQYLSQAIVPKAETYYDKPKLMDVARYVVPNHNGAVVGSSGATPPAHSAIPLVGSYLSSIGGVPYASNGYRGPYSPDVQQLKPQPTAVQKLSMAKVSPATQKVKGSPNTSTYVQPLTSFSFDGPTKPFYQSDDERFPQQQKQQQHQHQYQQQQRLILRPLNQHQQQEHQTTFQFYNPHQHQHQQQQQQQYQNQHQHQSLHHAQLNIRVKPQQQHFQYIIAVPLSYARQLQHQLATGSTEQNLRHEVPLSASKSEYTDAAHSVIGPLAREHYGSYQPVHYISNYQTQLVSAPAAQHHNNNQPSKPQYMTQYIQIPASSLNAALQASNGYQNQKSEQEHLRTTTAAQQSQPQFAYNINNFQNHQAQQQIQNHSPVYVHQTQEKPQTPEKVLQEAIIHVEGAKPSAKSTPTKTYIDNTQTLSTSTIPFKAPPTNSIVPPPSASPETLPIVHYNPIYVQGPQAEQQSLFGDGTLNYHRFATGGFHASAPVPIVRLSATPSQHFYNSLPQYYPYYQQQQHQQQLQPHQHYHQSLSQSQPHLPYRMALEHKTIYGGYTPQQIPSITEGLPYFTHPGGVHYGTHLYHHTPAFLASHSIAAKATETVNGSSVSNQHQLEQQQHHQQQSLHHPHFDASSPTSHSTSSASDSASSSASVATSLPSFLAAANATPTANGSAGSSPLVKYP